MGNEYYSKGQREIQRLATRNTAVGNEKYSGWQREIQLLATKNTTFFNELTFFSLPIGNVAKGFYFIKGKEKNQKK